MSSNGKIQKLDKLLENREIEAFRKEFLDLLPYDQALMFRRQNKEKRLQIYSYLSPTETASVMENIELEESERYITEMDSHYATSVLSIMKVDDAVDILKELDKDEVASFLALMDDEVVTEIKTLLHYEEKTAGSIMTTEYVSVLSTKTAKETLRDMKYQAPDAETIYYTYVLDKNECLVGVLSLRNLIVADEDEVVENIMTENVISVRVGQPQEDVAKVIRDYDFLAIPVVDFQNHLLGIITVDDILDVMEEEAHEDFSKLAALTDIDSPESSPLQSAKKRLPWLIILMFLGMITASLIGSFEDTLEEVPIVAIFIPLIAGMAGNSGTQSLAVAVRGLATGNYADRSRLKLMIKEIVTGLLIGIVCGILVTLLIFVWKKNLFLGMLVGIAINSTLIVATLSGALIPLIMQRFNIDPAVASGPFITTLNDITSVIIYFGLATVFMGMLL